MYPSDSIIISTNYFYQCVLLSSHLVSSSACKFTKSSTPPWVLFMFSNCANGTKSHKASQIIYVLINVNRYKSGDDLVANSLIDLAMILVQMIINYCFNCVIATNGDTIAIMRSILLKLHIRILLLNQWKKSGHYVPPPEWK